MTEGINIFKNINQKVRLHLSRKIQVTLGEIFSSIYLFITFPAVYWCGKQSIFCIFGINNTSLLFIFLSIIYIKIFLSTFAEMANDRFRIV